LFVEIGLFVITCGISYINDICENLQCVPFNKRHTVGSLQVLLFAPLIFKDHSNTVIRLIAKLILLGYNFVVYYFVTVAINRTEITIPIFCVVNYGTYCFYKFLFTNRSILKFFVDIKYMFRNSWLATKWQFYRVKFNTINTYRSSRNRMKIAWCETKTGFRQRKANTYNARHRYVVGTPEYKIAKVSQPRLLTLKVFKTYEKYHENYITRKSNRLALKNTIMLLKYASNKIQSEYFTRINYATIHDVVLWSSRYDDMLGQAPVQLLGELTRDNVVTFVGVAVNYIHAHQITNTTRHDEMQSYMMYKYYIDTQCDKLNLLIYELSGLNEQIDNTSKINTRIVNFINAIQQMSNTGHNAV
jgi:hypothetical protein